MTLIVGQRYPDGIRLVSDSRLTPSPRSPTPTTRIKPRTPYLEGALKVVTLHPAICVGYAGEQAVAYPAIRELAEGRRTGASLETVKEVLRSASLSDTDFIIASLSSTPALLKVQDGEVIQGGDRHWIGHSEAYGAFQTALSEMGGPGDSAEGPTGRISGAMGRLVREEVIPGVGDFSIEVRTSAQGFRYTGHGEMHTGPFLAGPSTSEQDEEGWDTAAGGAFAYTFLYPRQAGVGALGVYFYQGSLGALFYPAKSERAIQYHDVTHQEFSAAILAEHGIVMEGSRIETAPGRNIILR